MNPKTDLLQGRCFGPLRRPLSWAAALLLFAPLAFGVAPPQDTLDLPEVVVRGIDQVRLEAERAGEPPLEPPRTAQTAVRLEIPGSVRPTGELRAAPPVTSPGCAYRNPVTGALARAGGDPVAYYKTGLDRLSRDELDQAAFFFAAVRENHPDHPLADDSAFYLGEIQRRQGKPTEAITFYRLVQGQHARQAAYRLAWLLDAAGRSAEALTVWQAVAADPESPFRAEAYYRVGAAQLTNGALAAAIQSLERALVTEPATGAITADTLYALGLAQHRAGAFAPAEKTLLRFLLEYPGHPSAAAGQLVLGWALLHQGQAREAAHRFAWVPERSTDPALIHRALYGRVRAFADLGEEAEADRALAALEAEAPDGPWVGWGWADLAWLAFRNGRYDDALARYRDALRVWDGAGRGAPRYMAAESLYLLGNYSEAADAYRLVGSDSPLYPTALHRVALCELLAGDPAAAEAQFQQLLRQFPAYPQRDRVWAWLGESLNRLDRPDQALRAYRNVTPDSPAYPQAIYGQAWLAFEAERWDEAASLLTTFLRLSPGDPNRDEALLTLARAHFNRRQPRAALEALDLLENNTTDPSRRVAARYYRGWMLSRSGREGEGRTVLADLLHADPTGAYAARAHRTLAWLDYGQSEYEAALGHFEKVLALTADPQLETEAKTKRADSLFNLGRYAQALDAYRQLGDTPEAGYGAALCLQSLGDQQQLAAAAEAFATAFPDDPRAVDLFLALGRLRAEAGAPAAAATAYGRAARAAGNDDVRAAEAHLEAARSLVTAGETDAALGLLEELGRRSDTLGTAALRERAVVLERVADGARAQEAWVAFAARAEGEPRATALREAARWARTISAWDEAEGLLEQALAACPENEPVLRQALLTDLGETLLLGGQPDRATEPLSRAGEMGRSAEGLRALTSLGRAHEARGATEDALDTYLRLGYLYPLTSGEVAAALLRAGALLEELGDVERARQLYHKVSAEAPARWAERARDRLPAAAED